MLYGIFMSVMTCLCWGSTSVMMRGIHKLGAFEVSLLRAAGGLVCGSALFFAFHGGAARISALEAAVFVVMVLCNNVIGDVFLLFAVQRLGVARGAAIASSYPVVVSVASHFIFGSPFTGATAAGTLTAFAGTALLCRRDGGCTVPVTWSGVAYAVAASLFWAAGLLLNKALIADGLSPLFVTFGRGVTFFTIALALWLWEKERLSRAAWRIFLTRETFFAFAAGFCSLGFGAFFFSSALAYVQPAVATTIGASNPIAATIAAIIIYKEKPTIRQWAGIFLAVLGSALVTL